MTFKGLPEQEGRRYYNMPINNWAFDGCVLEAIFAVELGGETVWDSRTTEIAKARQLLDLYKIAFGIKGNSDVFTHIKSAAANHEGIDFIGLQQYMVETYRIIRDNVELWHKKPNRQYMRDRLFFILGVQLQDKINQKYIPDVEMRCVSGLGAILNWQSQQKASYAQLNNKLLRDSVMREMAHPGFFDGCCDECDKIERIITASEKYPRKAGQFLAISKKTARRYLREHEANASGQS